MILFDTPQTRQKFLPFTYNRPISSLRIGIQTIAEKWEDYLKESALSLTAIHIQGDNWYQEVPAGGLYINATVLPTPHLVATLQTLQPNESLWQEETLLAVLTPEKLRFGFEMGSWKRQTYTQPLTILRHLPDLFLRNADQIIADFQRLTAGRTSATITDPFTRVYAPENVFLEEGVSIKAAIINAENGPVYIGKNAIIQEGSLIIGPAAIGEGSMVAFGAKIRPNVTLGPVCRVGGEVGNSIFMGYSNKAHDGFLGNSVIGHWCNLGANTNNSNLKNDYKTVKLYDFASLPSLADTGELFCGTFMGDYSKAGISTMFNTGTIVGVSSNVFGGGFQSKFVPSFRWGGKAEGYDLYRFSKAIDVINTTMSRRGMSLTGAEVATLKHVFDATFNDQPI